MLNASSRCVCTSCCAVTDPPDRQHAISQIDCAGGKWLSESRTFTRLLHTSLILVQTSGSQMQHFRLTTANGTHAGSMLWSACA